MARFSASFLLLSILCTGALGGALFGRRHFVPGSPMQKSPSDSLPYDKEPLQDRVEENRIVKDVPVPPVKQGGLGLSAWGIISIIVCVSMLLIIIYYFMLFYPIIRKKESKYNVMDTESSA